MRDPKTVAFEINWPRLRKNSNKYKNPILTIWHNDPCSDGSDDSCGWFIRGRHVDQVKFEKIKERIHEDVFQMHGETELGLMNSKTGRPVMSTIAVVLNMYSIATWIHFDYNRKKQLAFMRKHVYDILHFAENPTDSLRIDIEGVFRDSTSKDFDPRRFAETMTNIIYPDIIRKTRKWYQHPKWHVHHWSFQFPGLQSFYRYWFQRCSGCKKMGFRGKSAYSNWEGSKVWCEDCEGGHQKTSRTDEPR